VQGIHTHDKRQYAHCGVRPRYAKRKKGKEEVALITRENPEILTQRGGCELDVEGASDKPRRGCDRDISPFLTYHIGIRVVESLIMTQLR